MIYVHAANRNMSATYIAYTVGTLPYSAALTFGKPNAIRSLVQAVIVPPLVH